MVVPESSPKSMSSGGAQILLNLQGRQTHFIVPLFHFVLLVPLVITLVRIIVSERSSSGISFDYVWACNNAVSKTRGKSI